VSTPYRVLNGRDEIVAASGRHPFVRCFAATHAVGFAAEDAVVWNRQRGEESALMGCGSAEALAPLVAALVEEMPLHRMAMPPGVYERLPSRWRPVEVSLWRWFYTETAPPQTAVQQRCRWLTPDEYEDVANLLRAAFPTASSWPDKPGVSPDWFGIRADDGELIACGHAQIREGVGPMLGSITVHPRNRRQGLAAAVTGWVTRTLLPEHPLVALGSYEGEDATHRIYRRLGYQDVQQVVSGQLPQPAKSAV
jgi:GNAT superfamily N-acetyltransferase